MPNINDINGVTIANLSKLDGVTKANIAKVLGITLEAAAAFLLDTYTGAAAGYSVRRIASGATNLMRIREDSGDTETDIGYDSNGDLDTAAIATHCGTANGFVVSWVDQSGNGNDADQSTTTAQPKIYDGTTQAVITENGKSAMDCASSALVASSVTLDSYYSWYYVAKPDAAGGFIFEHSANSDPNNGGYNYLSLNNSAEIYRNPNAATQNATAGGGYAGTSQTLIDWNYSGTWTAYKDGAALSIINGTGNYGDIGDSSATDELNLFSRNESTLFFNGKFQEIIFWNNDQDAAGNRTGIESDINSEYLIYQPTDAPTSGLLATYTGAAAAYSVRQLSDKAVIALRIRRDSDDEETNIGWDSNGDLDTTAISDFCGTANGYVTRWWDQSTNGNHADQATDTLQPQIYNGTAVFTNGSPARAEIRATTNARMTLGTLAHDVDRKYFGAATASVSSFCTLFGSNSTADYELLAKSGDTQSIFDGGGAIVNRNGALWYDAPTLNKDRNDVWTDFSSQSIFMIDHAFATVTGRTTQLGYATNGIPMFHMQELIIYPTGTSHAVSDIEDAINSYFQVYT